MLIRWVTILLGLLLSASVQAGKTYEAAKDLFYGQVLFDFHQQRYFSAITHLRTALENGYLYYHESDAELLLGGLYVSYGMQRSAEEVFNKLLNDDVEPEVRNQAWFYLAKIYKERGFIAKAKEILKKVKGPLPLHLHGEKVLLESSLASLEGDYVQAAVFLKEIDQYTIGKAYVQYNLGVEHMSQGYEVLGMPLLDHVSKAETTDEELLWLRDKANIALGYNYLINQQFDQAKEHFLEVDIYQPVTSQALLGLGWAEFGLDNREQAIAVWMTLWKRSISDPAVLEALLAVPYTLNEMGAHRQAVNYYEQAVETYNVELAKIHSIMDGLNFNDLAKELVNVNIAPEAGWYWRADVQAASVLGPYLYELLAEHEFQEALRNYRDLLYIDQNLDYWQNNTDAYESMIETRQVAYEGRLPEITDALDELGTSDLLSHRDALVKEFESIKAAEAAIALSTTEEKEIVNKLLEIKARLNRLQGGVDTAEQQEKFRLLRGLMVWKAETEYPERVWQAKKQFRQLDEAFDAVSKQRKTLNHAFKNTPKDFLRYQNKIAAVKKQIEEMKKKTQSLILLYQGQLQQLTVKKLKRIEERIASYQRNAMFSAAQIYDVALSNQKSQP